MEMRSDMNSKLIALASAAAIALAAVALPNQPKPAGVVVAGGFPVPSLEVLLSEQLSLQGLTIMVRNITATLIVRSPITSLMPTATVVAPTITAVVTLLRATVQTLDRAANRLTNDVSANKTPGNVPGFPLIGLNSLVSACGKADMHSCKDTSPLLGVKRTSRLSAAK